MPFKPNYGRDRAERQRAARAKSEEKQRKKEEKAALRKAQRDAAEGLGPDEPAAGLEAPPDDRLRDIRNEVTPGRLPARDCSERRFASLFALPNKMKFMERNTPCAC